MGLTCLHPPLHQIGEGVGDYAEARQHSRTTSTIMPHSTDRTVHSKYPRQDKIGKLWIQKTLTPRLYSIQYLEEKSKTNISFVKILLAATFLLAHWAFVTGVVLKIWYHGQALVMQDSVGKRRFCGWLW